MFLSLTRIIDDSGKDFLHGKSIQSSPLGTRYLPTSCLLSCKVCAMEAHRMHLPTSEPVKLIVGIRTDIYSLENTLHPLRSNQ